MSSIPRVGFIDSGLGLLGYADAFHRHFPQADLVLSMDPDFMPYGGQSPETLIERGVLSAKRAVEQGAEGIVVACNSLSVHALDAIRAELEPEVPVVGTVPAVRQGALTGKPFAVWATVATTNSQYQANLIEEFAPDLPVARVACPGLVEAIEAGDLYAATLAADDAARRTPDDTGALVLGCTHFGLVENVIRERVGSAVTIFDSPEPVARQMGRRLGLEPADEGRGRLVTVLHSGRPGRLPEKAAAFAAGRRLLHMP